MDNGLCPPLRFDELKPREQTNYDHKTYAKQLNIRNQTKKFLKEFFLNMYLSKNKNKNEFQLVKHQRCLNLLLHLSDQQVEVRDKIKTYKTYMFIL